MDIKKLQEYYNRIDECSIVIDREVDFDYIQTQITKIGIHTEDLSRIIGEILIEKTRLENIITDKTFEYELHFTQHLNDNRDIKKFGTGRERRDYINYFLLKEEYREIKHLEQESKDLESLLELARKKARDLDRAYPKLKTLWEAVQAEMKYIKKIGSDADYITRVKDNIDDEKRGSQKLFSDSVVEEIRDEQYNSIDTGDFEDESTKDSDLLDVDVLLNDL